MPGALFLSGAGAPGTRSLLWSVQMRIAETVEIARPRQEVWDFVANPVNDPRWCRKVKTVEPSGERSWRVVHKPVPLRPAIELELVQLELEEPGRLLIRQEDGVSIFDVEYLLEPTAGGTRFSQASEFEWKKLPRFLHRVFALGVRRDVHKQLQALRDELSPPT